MSSFWSSLTQITKFGENLNFNIPWWSIVLLCVATIGAILFCIHKFISPIGEYIKRVYIKRDGMLELQALPVIEYGKGVDFPLGDSILTLLITVLILINLKYRENLVLLFIVGAPAGLFFAVPLAIFIVNKIQIDKEKAAFVMMPKGKSHNKPLNVILKVLLIGFSVYYAFVILMMLREGSFDVIVLFLAGVILITGLVVEITTLLTYLYYLVKEKFFIYRGCYIIDVTPEEKKSNTKALVFRAFSLIMCVVLLSSFFSNIATVTIRPAGTFSSSYQPGATWAFDAITKTPITLKDFEVDSIGDIMRLSGSWIGWIGWLGALIIGLLFLALLSGILNFLFALLCNHKKKEEESITRAAISLASAFVLINFVSVRFMYILRFFIIVVFTFKNNRDYSLSEIIENVTSILKIECAWEKSALVLYVLCIVWIIWAAFILKTKDKKGKKHHKEYLEVIDIPNGVSSIGKYMYAENQNIKIVRMPPSVTSIGDYAFVCCSKLRSIEIPESVTSIGRGSFADCSSLTNIVIPKEVTSIGTDAFLNCGSLETITVVEGNTVYHSDGNCLIETKSKTLIQGCNNSVIPADGSVTIIEERAFSGCKNLTSIKIPNGVVSIKQAMFSGCNRLISIEMPDNITTIEGHLAFSGCSNFTIIYGGTVAQWGQIQKEHFWDCNTGEYTIHCTDGDIKK